MSDVHSLPRLYSAHQIEQAVRCAADEMAGSQRMGLRLKRQPSFLVAVTAGLEETPGSTERYIPKPEILYEKKLGGHRLQESRLREETRNMALRAWPAEKSGELEPTQLGQNLVIHGYAKDNLIIACAGMEEWLLDLFIVRIMTHVMR